MEPLSPFMQAQIPRLLKRFCLVCHAEDCCMHYALQRREDGKEISKELTLSINAFSHEIHVSKFYPELYRETRCHYLSAACLFLMTQHFGHFYGLDEGWGLYLDAEPSVFEDFYAKLQDFDFHTEQSARMGTLAVRAHYVPFEVETEVVQVL